MKYAYGAISLVVGFLLVMIFDLVDKPGYLILTFSGLLLLGIILRKNKNLYAQDISWGLRFSSIIFITLFLGLAIVMFFYNPFH